jgi:voltage-gated potassium channel
MMRRVQQLSPVAVTAMLRLSLVVAAMSGAVVLAGGTVVWQLERDEPASTFGSWADALWWAISTLTTVGYGDHVPVTTGGRFVAGAIMVFGVAMLGAVAAVVALYFARTIAAQEEAAFEAEAETLERRIESRLDGIEAQLRRIEQRLGESDRSQRSG